MIARYLYQNPRLLLLTIGIIAISGWSSFSALPRMEDPILTRRVALVTTVFPGANGQRVESLVTETLEKELSNIIGIRELRSETMAGFSLVSIELRDEITDVDPVWSRVRDKLADAAAKFPSGASEPKFRQLELKAHAAIIALKWNRADEANFAILHRLAKDMEQTLRFVPGTEDVSLFGDPTEEVVVELSPLALSPLGLTIADIARQIEESDAAQAAGLLRDQQHQLLIEVDEELDSLGGLRKTPIQYGNEGRLVGLGDIAKIYKTQVRPAANLAVTDGVPAIVLGAFVRDEQRIDRWAEQLDEALAAFQSTLPSGIEAEIIFSQSDYVKQRLDRLLWNLLLGTAAVVIVIFFMMGWRSMVVVGAALPLSALMVLVGMRVLGIPVHQMSVTGLIIALGLLIDNAIVIVDEVRARLWAGMAPVDAIGDAIGHLAFPLFSSTLTTTLAFVPIAMLPGSPGEFVGSIAVSVILAINASFLLAMTVVPALTAWLQPATPGRRTFWRYGCTSDRVCRIYRGTIVGMLHFPLLGILLGCSLPVLGFVLANQLPEQFFPPADRHQIYVEFEMSSPTSLAATQSLESEAHALLAAHEDVSRVHWFYGASAPTFYYNVVPRRLNASFFAQALVDLKADSDPRTTIRELQRQLDEQFAECRVLVRQLEQGPPFDAPIEVRLSGPDLAVLQQLGSQIRLLLSETSEVLHTRSDLEETVPKIELQVDDEESRLTGLTNAEIARQMYTSLEGMLGGTLMEDTEELPIRVRMPPSTSSSLEQIANLELKPLGPRGRAAQGPVLSAISQLGLGSEVASISRINGRRLNEVKAYITAGTLPAEVITEFEQRLNDSDFQLPPGYAMEFGGEAAQRDEAVGNLLADISLLVALAITILVVTFQSFRVSGVIAAVGGLSIGLGVGALWCFGYPFGFMAIVGTMGLVGVAINDAIVVMAAIRADKSARAGDVPATADVVVRCTRHVVATSLTTMVGFAPLVLGGGGFWPPLAVTIAGGVGGATILALYFVPSLYLLLVRGVLPSRKMDRAAGTDTRVGDAASRDADPHHST